MAIVLPRRKKADIFAPRKSVQDAKEKLGPAFFDPSLLECSRNAIELTRLVNKWDDIDKEKVKLVRELTREQNVIARSYKKSRMSMKDSNVPSTAEDCIETADGKQIPPGFRFRSNGDLKPSLISLPHVSVSLSGLDVSADLSDDNLEISDSKIKAYKLEKERSTYGAIDYSKEIDTLRGVIIDLCEELSKSKVSLIKSHSGNFKSYLRAHANDQVSITDITGELYRSPNDRFAFRPGSSTRNHLYKQTVKTPSSRACVGCQFKLRQENEELQKMKVKQDKDILKRRWSYVPSGKYVQSSTALSSNISLHQSPSSPDYKHDHDVESRESRPHVVHFRPDSEIILRGEMPPTRKRSEGTNTQRLSKSANYKETNEDPRTARKFPSSPICSQTPTVSTDSDVTLARSLHSAMSRRSAPKSGSSVMSSSFRLGSKAGSSLSNRSIKSTDRATSRLLVDYDSRLNLLKQHESEHLKECDAKIRNFLKDLDTVENPRKTKFNVP